MRIARCFFLFAVFFCAHNVWSTSTLLTASISKSHTTLHLKSSVGTIQPNTEFWLLLDWSLDPNWYIYAQNPGDGGMPPQFDFELPAGITVEETVWPKAHDLSKQGLTIYGYTNACQTFIRLKAAHDYKPSPLHTIRLGIRWGICHDQCIIEDVTLGITFPTSETFDAALHKHVQVKEGDLEKSHVHNHDCHHQTYLSHLLFLLILAFMGGMILNLMPCVLPVLSLKLLDFAKLRDDESGANAIRQHVFAYTAGILVTFQALNAALMGLRLLGRQVGWGFQLQSPAFIIFLACLFLALTLNLFGVFEIGLRMNSFAHTKDTPTIAPHELSQNLIMHSFLKGMLACLVATPCSAPFMGTAIAASLAQPFWMNTLIFLMLGVGLSLPFLSLLIWPNVIRRLPKPGAWMLTLKQFMGFLMLGSALWMLWILNVRFADAMPLILVGLWFISLGLWGYGKLCTLYSSLKQYGIGIVLCVVCGIAALSMFYSVLDETKEVGYGQTWEPYTEKAVDKARAEKRPVLINFTARWCVTCQTNKKFVLESTRVRERLKAADVALFEADWTHYDASITKKLESLGHNSIPLVVYYPKGQEKPIVLPALLTVDALLDAVS